MSTTLAPTSIKHAPTVKTLIVLAVGIVLINAQLYDVIPLLPELASRWRIPAPQTTWLSTAIAIGYVAGFIVIGPLNDRLDRRQVLAFGAAATAITSLAMALADGFAVAVALRTAQGFTASIFAPAAFVYIGSRVAPKYRPLAVSIVVSSAMSAAVVGQIGGQLLNAQFGWRAVFIASAIALTCAATALWTALIADPAAPSGRIRDVYTALPRLLTNRALAPLYLVTLTLLGGFVAVYTTLQLAAGMSDGQLMAMRIAAFPAIIAIPLLAGWTARFTPATRATAWLTISAVTTAAVALRPGDLGLGILLLLYTAGIAGASPGVNEMIAARAGERKGAAMSLYTAMLMTGASFTPPLVGAAAPLGLESIFVAIAIMTALAAFGTWTRRTKAPPQL